MGNYGVTPVRRRVARAARGRASSSARRRPLASNWRAGRHLPATTSSAHGIVAIAGIDTRALTRAPAIVRRDARRHRHRASRSPRRLDRAGPRDRRRWRARTWCGERHVRGSRSTTAATARAGRRRRWGGAPPLRRRLHAAGARAESAGSAPLVAAYDFGMKWNILRRFAAHGCRVRVFPATDAGQRGAARRRPTGCSSATVPAIRRPCPAWWRTSRQLLDAGPPGVRHLPGPPDSWRSRWARGPSS